MKYNTNKGRVLSIKPENEINSGGEGKIMLIENQPNLVAKIFHNSQDIDFVKRLSYLNNLDKNIFVTPNEIIFQNSKVIGYTMQYVDNQYLPISTFFSKNYCQKNKINFDFKKKVAQNLRLAIKNAHKNNIVIGDLNQFNVLVNLKAELKIIDTDSFETPANKHSGVLLDEIRDYLNNGNISKESDYFAFSILVFYLLTFTHPFKGIHSRYKNLKDRMVNRIPIIVSSTELKTPNCYTPIIDSELNNLFKRIYVNGERFLISLDKTKLFESKISKVDNTTNFNEKHIIIKIVLKNSIILNSYFNDTLGYVETQTAFLVFSSKNTGYLSLVHEIEKTNIEKIFVGNRNILVQKSGKLYHFKNKDEVIEIKNFKLHKKLRIEQKENILVMIGENKMFWLYIDEIINDSIKNQRFEVFGESFSMNFGMIQNIRGTKRIFYNTGNSINSLKTDKNIKFAVQNKNIGIIQYVENKNVQIRYFSVFENEYRIAEFKLEEISNFCYMKTSKNNGIIFVSENGSIKVLRTEDFNTVSEIKCSVVNSSSILHWTKAGIIVSDEKNVFLINSKVS